MACRLCVCNVCICYMGTLNYYLLTQYGNNQNEQEDKKGGGGVGERERWIRTEAEIMNAQFR
jgi:hypothetical protein